MNEERRNNYEGHPRKGNVWVKNRRSKDNVLSPYLSSLCKRFPPNLNQLFLHMLKISPQLSLSA